MASYPIKQQKPIEGIPVDVEGIAAAFRFAATDLIVMYDDADISDEDIAQMLAADVVYLTWPGSTVRYFVFGASGFRDEDNDWILG